MLAFFQLFIPVAPTSFTSTVCFHRVDRRPEPRIDRLNVLGLGARKK